MRNEFVHEPRGQGASFKKDKLLFDSPGKEIKCAKVRN